MSAHERERLSAYLDGELPPAERGDVEAHLAACPECTALLANLAAVDEAAAALPAEAPAGYFDSFPARVRARLEARPTRLPRKAATPARRLPIRRLPAWTWAAAAALLLAVITPLTLRHGRPAAYEARPSAPAAVPKVIPMAPHQDLGVEARAPEAKATPAPPAGSRAPSGLAATPRSEQRFAVEPPASAAAPPQKRDQPAEGRPAPRPTPPPQPAELGLARQQAAADAESEGAAGGVPGGVVAGVVPQESSSREKVERAAPQPAVQAEAGSPMMSAPSAHEAKPASLKAQEDAFSRLEAVRPRTAAGWRRVREQWKALAAAETDPVRADEERVRAIIAAREAWQAEGDGGDETVFRIDAEAYLRREDARQKPRVEALLAEAPRRAP